MKIEFSPTRRALLKSLQSHEFQRNHCSALSCTKMVLFEGCHCLAAVQSGAPGRNGGCPCVTRNQEWRSKKEDKSHNRGHNLLGPQHVWSEKNRKARCGDNARPRLGIGCSKFSAQVPKTHVENTVRALLATQFEATKAKLQENPESSQIAPWHHFLPKFREGAQRKQLELERCQVRSKEPVFKGAPPKFGPKQFIEQEIDGPRRPSGKDKWVLDQERIKKGC